MLDNFQAHFSRAGYLFIKACQTSFRAARARGVQGGRHATKVDRAHTKHSSMTARLAQGGTSWDDMLDAAVLQGLTATPGEETAAPNQRRLTSGAEDGEYAEGAEGAGDAYDDVGADLEEDMQRS